ncbi:MAG: hypothetical protein WC856_23315 [Methylococcaceae bacterium]|jgi:hypothetical protein
MFNREMLVCENNNSPLPLTKPPSWDMIAITLGAVLGELHKIQAA